MEHSEYVKKCSEVVKTIIFREVPLREALISAAEICFENFPIQDVPYGDGNKCEEVIDLLTNERQNTISETVSGMDDHQVIDIVERIYLLNIELIIDETMQKVDNQWKSTYLHPMRFHN